MDLLINFSPKHKSAGPEYPSKQAMPYPRTAIVVLLVFAILGPAATLSIYLPIEAYYQYASWRSLVGYCLRTNQPPPQFQWSPYFELVTSAPIKFIWLTLPGLALGAGPALWTWVRGNLPNLIVLAPLALIVVIASLSGVASDPLTALLLSVMSASSLLLLRRIGVRG